MIDKLVFVSLSRIPVRLTAEKVPEEVLNQRLKRYKSENKKNN